MGSAQCRRRRWREKPGLGLTETSHRPGDDEDDSSVRTELDKIELDRIGEPDTKKPGPPWTQIFGVRWGI